MHKKITNKKQLILINTVTPYDEKVVRVLLQKKSINDKLKRILRRYERVHVQLYVCTLLN